MPNIYRECRVQNLLELASLFTFSRRKFPEHYTFSGETHDFWEAVTVLNGKVGITADKNVFSLAEGEMLLHPPGEFHAIWSDMGSSPEIVIFSFRAERFPPLPRRLFRLSQEIKNELCAVYEMAVRAFVMDRNDVREIKTGFEGQAGEVMKRLELLLLRVINGGGRTAQRSGGRGADNYVRILSVMENKLSQNISVEELAQLCCMSVPSLEKTVARYAGCGAMRCFRQLKMQRAAELLQSGERVKEAALSVGYRDQNYFSACFKKWSGLPPTKYGKG